MVDFDDLSIAGLLFAVIGFIIGIIVANSMDGNILIKLASGAVSAIACYFIGGKIAEG